MLGTLLWNFTGSTWFNMLQPLWWKMSALWLWDCCLHYTGIAENAGEWPDLDQDSHNANLRLLSAEGFRCEVAILRGQQHLVSWSLWCRCRHCHGGWGARLSSLRQPDLRLGLQEQSLCGRRPGWAPCNACCRRSRLSIDMWGTDFLFMALQVGLSENWMLDHHFPHHSIRRVSWDESPIFRTNPHVISANLSQDIPQFPS